MKRKIAWLALPLVLLALMFGVKWRTDHPPLTETDHPPLTEEDMRFRALLSSYPSMDIVFKDLSNRTGINHYVNTLSKQELQPLIECFYLSSKQPKKYHDNSNSGLYFGLNSPQPAKTEAHIDLSVNSHEGFIRIYGTGPGNKLEGHLHAVTTKRLIDLLISNPLISPELRNRMNQ